MAASGRELTDRLKVAICEADMHRSSYSMLRRDR